MNRLAQNKAMLPLLPVLVAIAAWLLPGAGHWLLGEKKRAMVFFPSITALFVAGLFIGSLGVIDPKNEILWYYAQVMASPIVMIVARLSTEPVYGRSNEIGQIYTSVAGLLNLLCIFHAVVIAEHLRMDSLSGGRTGR